MHICTVPLEERDSNAEAPSIEKRGSIGLRVGLIVFNGETQEGSRGRFFKKRKSEASDTVSKDALHHFLLLLPWV